MEYSRYERLSVTRPSPGVLRCELNRPEKLNAFDERMWADLREFFAAVKGDVSCRCVLLSGSGRAFTAGLDLMASAGLLGGGDGGDSARRGLQIRTTGEAWQLSFTNMAECGKPVVACVHGACIGAGIECISAADVRFCAQDVVFEMAEVDVALAADVGGLQRFPKLVGNDSLVRELALSSRRFGAEEALRMGFVSRICASREDLIAQGLALCEQIAAKSPVATLGVKTMLNFTRDHSVRDSLDFAITWNMNAIQTEDMASAAAAKMSRAQGVFKNLDGGKLDSKL